MTAGQFRARWFRPEHVADRLDGIGSEIAYRTVEKASDAYYSALGGPWIARYRRSALMAGIGLGRDQEVHFHDPADALAFFDGLGRRYRRNPTLRASCLITYKDAGGGGGGWYAVEPFASDAADAVDVMRAEVARDEGRWQEETRGGTYRDPKPRRLGGRTRKRRTPGGSTSGGMTDAEMYAHFTGENPS